MNRNLVGSIVVSETFRFDIATGNSLTMKTATRCNFINREPVWLFVFLGQRRKYTILLSGFYSVNVYSRVFHNSLPSVNTRSDKKTNLHDLSQFRYDSEHVFFFTTSNILLVLILITSKIKANRNFNQQFACLLVLISSPGTYSDNR